MTDNTRLDLLYKALGLRIRKARKERKISQIDLAYECGMESSNLNRIERGNTNPSATDADLWKELVYKILH